MKERKFSCILEFSEQHGYRSVITKTVRTAHGAWLGFTTTINKRIAITISLKFDTGTVYIRYLTEEKADLPF